MAGRAFASAAGLCQRAREIAGILAAEGSRILVPVEFNQVLVACASPELTTATLARIQQSGVCWCGGTTWRGEPAIRISVCSWATTAEDIRLTALAFVCARKEAEREGRTS